MNSLVPPAEPLARQGLARPALGERSSFPDLEFVAYLGHAAIAPTARVVRAAVEACLDDTARRGAAAFPIWDLQRARLRRSLESWLGAAGGEIALTPGTTRGVTDLALGLPFRRGDRLVTFAGEFPANVTPWQRAASAFSFEVEFLSAPDPRTPGAHARVLEDVERALVAGARYVALSAVQFQTGFRMPLAEIAALCRKFDALSLVDAIQAVGVVPLDVGALGIDALVGGAHKWLLGLEGAGFSYVSHALAERLRPLTVGWVSHQQGEDFLFRGSGLLRYDRPLREGARVFEGSSLNAIGFAAMEAGVELCKSLGTPAIYAHVQRYFDGVEPQFQARGFRSLRAPEPESRSCILSFEPPEGIVVADLARELRERGVMVSTPDGLIRLAPHFANAEAEIPVVVAALDEALAVLGH